MKYLLIIIALFTGMIAYSQNQPSTVTQQNNADFTKTITDLKVQLVDARTPTEYVAGHIPGAVNMDVTKPAFDKQITTLDKKQPVAVYCRSGSRSKAAARKLAAQGFKVYELGKGFNHWNGKIEK